MRIRTLGYIFAAGIVLAGCGRFGDSGWNPLGWMGGGSNQPTTLAPEGGYVTEQQDTRALVARITAARWEPLYEGRMLVVTALPATKGWWDLELVTEAVMPGDRIRPDDYGVLRLRLVGNPPNAEDLAGQSAPNPASDSATVALTLPHEALRNLREVVISGASNSVSLRP